MRKLVTVFLCVFFALCQLAAQNKTITGKVTDAEGKPVAGASVQVKGTKQGVSANDAGIFTISVPTTATTLSISGVGNVIIDSINNQITIETSKTNNSLNGQEIIIELIIVYDIMCLT